METLNSTPNITITGSADADSIRNESEASVVAINALGGNDTVYNIAQNVTINGGADDDSIENNGNDGKIDSGDGNDFLRNYGSNVTIQAGAGADSIYNNAATVSINAGDDADYITSSYQYVTINAGRGNDSIRNTGSNVTIQAGGGADSIYNSASTVSINAGANGDTISNYGSTVTINGGTGNDTIESSGNNVTIVGGGEDDEIRLLGKNEVIEYALGDGNDTIHNISSNTLIKLTSGSLDAESISDDNLILQIGDGSLVLVGVADRQMQILVPDEQNLDGVIVTVNAGKSVYADNYNDGSIIFGSEQGDSIYNEGASVTIDGGAGDDTVYNRSGYCVSINAGADNDSIYNYYGEYATINAGAGNDSIYNYDGDYTTINAGAGNDSITNDGDYTTINASAGNDTIYNRSGYYVSINAGAGNDVVINNSSNISVNTGAGNDTIQSSGSNVTVDAGDDNNLISIYGGSGNVYSGAGNDSIVFGTGYYSSITLDGFDPASDTLTFQRTIANQSLKKIVRNGDTILSSSYVTLTFKQSSATTDIGNCTVDNNGETVTVEQLIAPPLNIAQINTALAANDTGVFVIDSDATLASVTAEFKAASEDGDSVIGSVNDVQMYYSGSNELRQNITATDNWSVTASINEDTINVVGESVSVDAYQGDDVINVNGDDATVIGGGGWDTISIGSNVKVVSISDLDFAEDELSFEASIAPGSLVQSKGDGQINLTAGDTTVILQNHSRISKAAGNHTVNNGGNITTLTELLGGTSSVEGEASDIVFLFDISGSMDTHIEKVKNAVTNFVKSLESRNVDVQLGLVTYEDNNNTTAYDLTDDVDAFIETVTRIGTTGGTENGLTAIMSEEIGARSLFFRAGAKKRFIVLTDENYDDASGFNLDEVIETLHYEDIVIDVVGESDSGSSESCYDAWNPIATITGGQFYDINFPTYDEILNNIAREIIRSYDFVGVDLADATSDTGFFVQTSVVNEDSDTVVSSIAQFRVETLEGDEIVGSLSADHVYHAVEGAEKQSITVPGGWFVVATDNNDEFHIIDSDVTVSSGLGADAFYIDSDVKTLTINDLALDSDTLNFTSSIPPRSLRPTVNDDRLSLNSADLTIALSDKSTLDENLLSFIVNNNGTDTSIQQLIADPVGVALSSLSNYQSGFFVLESASTNLDAVFRTTYSTVAGDIIVGTVGGGIYTAVDNASKQIINAGARWSVTATADDDTLNINGNDATLTGGDGADLFVVDSDVTTFAVNDFETVDTIRFVDAVTEKSLIPLEDGGNLTLASDQMNIALSNKTLAELQNYTVDNGDIVITLDQLVADKISEPATAVDLSNVTDTGVFVVDGYDTLNDGSTLYDASLKAEAAYNELIVGSVASGNIYEVSTLSGAQSITAAADWLITASDFDDTLNITGDNVTVNSKDGADSIAVGSGVSTITFSDLDTSSDALSFDRSIATNSLLSTVDAEGTTLASDQITLVFKDKALTDIVNYTVDNGSARNSIYELLFKPVENPNANVNLFDIADSSGYFVIDGLSATESDIFYNASLKSDTLNTDIVIGEITGDHVYAAQTDAGSQSITANADWLITASDFDDTLNITGDNVTVNAKDGADLIAVGSGVSTITFSDLDTSSDALSFDRSIATNSLLSTVDADGTTLASDQITLIFKDKALTDIVNYTVNNGSARNSIDELLFKPVENPNANVNLAEASGSSGYFVIDGLSATDSDTFYSAAFKTATVDNDIIVGSVSADHVYSARNDLGRQSIIADAGWNVTASNLDDTINVTGSNVTIGGGTGSDFISIADGASMITFADLESVDAVSFDQSIALRSLDSVASRGNLTLRSDQINLTFNGKSMRDLRGYTVDNNGTVTSIQQLVDNPVRVNLAGASGNGIFAINPASTVTSAAFKAEAEAGDIIVGANDSDTYVATNNEFRQNITAPEGWNITASDNDDSINVIGEHVTISSGAGLDTINVGAGVGSINIVDLDLDSDTLNFETAIRRRSLDTVQGDDGVTLQSDQINLVLSNTNLNNVLDYEVGNGSTVNSIDELIKRKTMRVSNVDVVFVIDNTGSMDDYITRVKEAVTDFAKSLSNANINYRLGLVEFGDIAYPGEKTMAKYDFTTDTTLFIQNVNAIYATGGYSEPESGLEALTDSVNGALSMDFLDIATKRFIVISDASFHDRNDTSDIEGDSSTYLFATDVLDALQRNDVTMDVVGKSLSGCQDEWEPLATATGGHFYDISLWNYDSIMADISSSIRNQFNFYSVDLTTVESGAAGVLVPHVSLDANENTIISSEVEFRTAASENDTIVGTLARNQTYRADTASDRQVVTIPSAWNVFGTDNADDFKIIGAQNTIEGGAGNDVFNVRDSNNTLSTGDGNDRIELDSSVGRVVITDFTLESDTLKFNSTMPLHSFSRSVGSDNVTLSRGSMSIVLQGLSALEDNYIVDNNGRNTSIFHLLARPVGVNLAALSSYDNGHVVIESESVEKNAVFRSADNTVEGDVIVGSVDSRQYTADENFSGQEITVGSNWNVIASAGDDTVSVTGGNSTVNAGAGNDIIVNIGSNVLINADDSTAVLSQLASSDLAFNADVDEGTDGDDTIYSEGNYITLNAGGGNDSIHSSGSNSYIDGGAGNDHITIAGNGSTVAGGEGNDSITVAENVTLITFADLDTAADSLTFRRSIAEGSLYTLETDDGDLALYSDSIMLVFVGKSLDDIVNYTVNNGSARNSIDDLLYHQPTLSNPDSFIDLSTVPAGTEGYFVVNKYATPDVDQTYYSASFSTSLDDDVIAVGSVTADRTYAATSNTGRQFITVNDDWLVTASTRDDAIYIGGSNVTVTGGNGADSIAFGADVESITLTDLASADSLAFVQPIALRSLDSVASGGNLTLSSDQLTLNINNKTMRAISGYLVDNAGTETSLYQLVANPIGVNLSSAGTGTGLLTVDPTSTRRNASLKSAAESTDIVIGRIDSSKVYVADESSPVQSITASSNWDVTATDGDDSIKINGSGSTVDGAAGADSIVVGNNVSTITFANFDSDDAISFDRSIAENSLESIVADDGTADGVTLRSAPITLIFDGVSLSEIVDYEIGNGSARSLIRDLIATSTPGSVMGGVNAAVELTDAANGYYVVDGSVAIDSDTVYPATFKTSTVGTDIVVGDVDDRNYFARDVGRQSITATEDGWSITANDLNDTINTSGKNITVNAGAGNDVIGNTGASNVIFTGDGDDFVYTADDRGISSGNYATIESGDGNDTIAAACIDVIINGGSGADSIANYSSDVTIFAGDGNDYILNSKVTADETIEVGYNHRFYRGPHYRTGAAVSIVGGEGDDTIVNYGDDVTINGSAGNDVISINGGSILFTYADGDGDDTVCGFDFDSSTIQIADGLSTVSTASGNDMIINVTGSTVGSITLKDYFSSDGNINSYVDLSSVGDGAVGSFVVNGSSARDGDYLIAEFTDALRHNDHRYQIYSDIVDTWDAAKDYAENLGGHLAIINDEEENTALYNYMISQGYRNAYFGLSDVEEEGTWKWVDGTELTYTKWGVDTYGNPEPNGGTDENYGMYYALNEAYTWNDGSFKEGRPAFLVEWDSVDDTVVGDVSSERIYSARNDLGRQSITVTDNWLVTASNLDDSIFVTGDASTVNGGAGNDSISVADNVSSITFGDFDPASDVISFARQIAVGSLTSIDGNLYSDQINLTFENISDEALLNATVDNAGTANFVYELISPTTIPRPEASHRVQLYSWAYGFTPTGTYIADLASIDEERVLISYADGSYALVDNANGNGSIWGGDDGDDTLVGTDGFNEFFYLKGNGNDVIDNAGDNDVINLLNIGLEDIDLESFPYAIGDDSTTIKFNDGGSIKVNGTSEVGFKVAGVDCTFRVKDRQWGIK